MRILFHISGGIVGGAETQVAYLINNLPDSVTALVTYTVPAMEKFIFKNIRTKHVHRIFSANDLTKKIAAFAPDIIQYYHDPNFYGMLQRLPITAKIVEIAHNRSSFPWDCSTYPKDRCDILVCVSPDARDHYISKRGENVRMAIIPNGVDTEVFYPRQVHHEKNPRPLGGFCGRLEGGDGKGVESIVEVIKKLPVDMELVGYDFGNWKQKLKDSSQFKVLPHTPNIADHYRNWDFFISCSPKEGFGLAIAEALACGLPSVILNCGGICHYIKHDEHAYIAKDIIDVERGVRTVISGVKYDPLAVDFSAKTMAKRYMDLYSELIEEQRRDGVKVSVPPPKVIEEPNDYTLGVVPDGWQGIRRAIEQRTTEICTPEKAVAVARSVNPGQIIFGGFLSRWFTLARALRNTTKARIIITYHGTPMMDEFGKENRDGLIHAISAVKEGYADCISFPHEGMARAFNNLYKVSAIFEPNIMTAIIPPKVEKLKGLHIGLFGTGLPWKNMDTQIIAAAITPGLTMLHVQNLHHPELPNQLGISYRVHPYFHDRNEFYKMASGMKVNLAVTITEAFGYFALESFMLGVPAIVGATTPSLRGAQGALKKCIVNYIDDPAAISDAIMEVLDDYDNVLAEGQRLVKKMTR